MNKIFESKTNIATTISSGFCGQNVQYCLNTDGVLTIFGTGDMYSWDRSSLAPWDANRSNIKKITIEEGVTSIGDAAFVACPNLTTVTISNSVATIGNAAFWSCERLASLAIGNKVATIGEGAFAECNSLTYVAIPNNVTSIGDYAFNSCTSLTSVTIGARVDFIGLEAFLNCENLKNVYYHGTAEEWNNISIGSFNTKLQSAIKHYDIKAIVDSGTCGKNLTWKLDHEGVLTISGTGAMTSWTSSLPAPWHSNRSKVKKVIISNGVTSIGEYAFSLCVNLTSVTIPDSVTFIEGRAFGFCSSLTGIVIPNRVMSIGECSFWGCSNLTSIIIPNSVAFIGDHAFYDCDNLTDVYYNGTEEDWTYIKIDSHNLPLEEATKHFSIGNKLTGLKQIVLKKGSSNHLLQNSSQHARVVRVSKTLYDIALETAIKNGFEKTFEGNCGADFQRNKITLSIEKQEDSSVLIKGRKRPRYFGSRIKSEVELKSFFKDLMGGDLHD